ncbi:hypothetical protein KR51_00004140 [Rubidibacter lacunae KORDI 51-2]|uniref:Uncharacterized protein n=1 Tax=Rubidibacter lacunae KORDI 51-2 TaxID=582515 RepID=U5DE66_9CHRO|nr:hypothetical protein [Rubidibacter lacunae]ERN42798.1 hypothetical protein KR51_00004140 [Rubidibacter lacunae KORDI 51-2]
MQTSSLIGLFLTIAGLVATSALAEANAVPDAQQVAQSRKLDSNAIGIHSIELNRAKNLARQAAERFNGGLSNYRAEPVMHGDPLTASFLVGDDRQAVTFTFRGYRPRQDGAIKYVFESVVRVDLPSGETDMLYNGPIRDDAS